LDYAASIRASTRDTWVADQFGRPLAVGIRLQGSLANTNDTLKITITPLSMDERTKVWYAVQRTYRLFSAYEVRVVNLDSSRRETRPPVREYHRHTGTRIEEVSP
jgi:hypothetical protein